MADLGTESKDPHFQVHPLFTEPQHLKTNILKEEVLDLRLKNNAVGFPGGAVVESLPAGAGDAGSSPDLGGSHVPRSDWAREPQLLSLRVWSLCSAAGEAVVVGGPRTAMRRWPPLAAAGESPRAETRTQHSHK